MPTVTDMQLLQWLEQFLLVLFRVGGLVMVAPVFGSRSLPMQVRVMLAVGLTLALFPIVPPVPVIDPVSLAGAIVIFQQILIGAATGLILQLAFDAVVIGIQTVSMSMGLGFAIMVDSASGVQVPTMSQFHLILATLLFLAMNGHLLLVQLLIDSFATLPVGSTGLDRDAFWMVAGWGSTVFAGAVKVALPAVTAVLIANVSIGVISRAAPTLNLFAIGLPSTILVGMVMLLITLPSFGQSVTWLIERALETITRMIGG
ncbi:MAG: flagellar biosynthetic protein FliR [Wenzhouxiangellaceae bacterium]|nr:flagellar biosynthetic protein FliR [Wenzhouxiangellaceae bacterium]